MPQRSAICQPNLQSILRMYKQMFMGSMLSYVLLCPTARREAQRREPSYPAWYTQTTCSAYIRCGFPFALLHLLLTAPAVSKLDHQWLRGTCTHELGEQGAHPYSHDACVHTVCTKQYQRVLWTVYIQKEILHNYNDG